MSSYCTKIAASTTVQPFLTIKKLLAIIPSMQNPHQTFVGLEDVLKTSSTRLQRNNFTSSKTSWRPLARRLQDVLEDEKLLRWRRLVLHVLKTSWRHLEDVLKTFLEDLLKILWRQTKYLLGISVYLSRDLTNLNVYLTSLYFTNLCLTTLKRIQNALITGVWFGVKKLA